jgi:hypothetical protein
MSDVTSDVAALIANPNPDQLAANPAPVAAPATPSAPQPPTAQQAMAADVAHHALFGKAVKSMVGSLNNTQTAYKANPQTGQVEEVQVPQRPGSFFRNLLSGMLIGAAAGSGEGKSAGGGFLGGVGRGAVATMQNRQQQDQERFKRAQDQLKSQMEREKQTSEETMHAAITAHENVQTADLLHNMHAADQKTVEEHNAASRAYQKSLTDAGAVPAKLSIGGQLVDATDANSFLAAYTKDPSIAHAPTGSERHFISTTDLSELHFDGDHWVDDSGNPVNLGRNIIIRAYDLPSSTLNTPRQYSGREVNAARRQKIVDDKGTYTMTPNAFSAIYTLGTKDAAESAHGNNQRSLTDQRNKNAKQFTEIEAKKASALAKAEHNYWTAINGGKDADNALSELNTAKQESQDAYENEIRTAGGTPKHFEYGNASAPQSKSQAQPAPKTFSPSKWKAANPNGDVNEATAEAKRQGMTISK